MLQKIQLKDLKVGKKLGEGGFGHAFLAYLKSCPKTKYVYKEVKEHNSFVNENTIWTILSTLNLSNLVHCYAIVRSGNNDIGFLFEYVKGQLYTLSRSENSPFPKRDTKKFAEQSIHCLLQLHKHNIAHNDISARNMFWDPETKIFTLIDFGCALLKNNRPIYDYDFDNHHYIDELPVKCGEKEVHRKLQNYWDKASTWLQRINPEAVGNKRLTTELLIQHLIVHPAPFRYYCMSDNQNLLLKIETFNPNFFKRFGIDIKDDKYHSETGMKSILDRITKSR